MFATSATAHLRVLRALAATSYFLHVALSTSTYRLRSGVLRNSTAKTHCSLCLLHLWRVFRAALSRQAILRNILKLPAGFLSFHAIYQALWTSTGFNEVQALTIKISLCCQKNSRAWRNWKLLFLRPVVTGGVHLKPFRISEELPQLIYTTRNTSECEIPNILDWVNRHASKITCKEVQQGKHPIYALHRPREVGLFEREFKLLGVITAGSSQNSSRYATAICHGRCVPFRSTRWR